MSSASHGNFAAGGGDPGRKSFFCHQCNQTVTIVVSPSAEPLCPRCNDGFLEEYENPSPDWSRSPPFFDPFSSLLPLLFPTSSATHTTATAAPTANANANGDFQPFGLFSYPSASPSGPSEDRFDPFAFLMSHLQDLQSGGAQIQFVVENSPSEGRGDGGFRLPANAGDYFIGPGLEQLIQQLAENDPNRHGTPPASKVAVENLLTIKVSEDQQNSEMSQCAVCLDDFEMDMEVKQMPCKHVYHADCLLPWLKLHNSCPVCRHELPTEDPDYENQRGATQGNAQGGGGGTSSGGGENRTFRRSFSITLPYPFRGNDGSNSASGGE